MIMKVMICKEDNQTEVFEISNYYTEHDYLEAAMGKDGTPMDREIILQDNNYMNEDDYWEEILIMSDSGIELKKFVNEKKHN